MTITNPVGPCTSVFVLLHDDESNGNTLCEDLRSSLGSPVLANLLPGARIICMDAPHKNLRTNEYGAQIYTKSWYDGLLGNGSLEYSDLWGQVKESVRCVQHHLDKAVEQVGAANVFLGGEGQGCGMAVLTLLQRGSPIGGVFGTRGYLCPAVCHKIAAGIRRKAVMGSSRTPAFISHGTKISTQPLISLLREAGHPVKTTGAGDETSPIDTVVFETFPGFLLEGEFGPGSLRAGIRESFRRGVHRAAGREL